MANKVEIIIGTYEEFLLGYRLGTKNDQPVLQQSFADKSHAGSVKSVAVHGSWIATGGSDDRIFVYDMVTRKQHNIILSHEGTVNAMAFTPDNTHLLSVSDDGHLLVTRVNTWAKEGDWTKAHNGSPVTHISCHPSGKMALTLGGDLILRTWNLVKGRVAYKTNLKSRGTLGFTPDCLSWSPNGEHFTLTGLLVVEIWSVATADVLQSVKTPSKPVSLCWVADEECLVGLEDGKIMWITLNAETEKLHLLDAHSARVKALSFLKGALVSVSSLGEVKLWQIDEKRKKLKEIAAVNIGCRPTCLGLLDLEQFGEEYLNKPKLAVARPEEPAVKPKTKKQKPQERAVVTIEYENDDEAAALKEESEVEEDEEEEGSSDAKEEEEQSAEEEDSAESGDSADGFDSDEESDDDPTPRRKRKQQQPQPTAASKQKRSKQAEKQPQNPPKKGKKTAPPPPAKKAQNIKSKKNK